jgi:hypothetical protein
MLKSQTVRKDWRTEGFLQQPMMTGESKFYDGGDQ